jgi:hypothetical protein
MLDDLEAPEPPSRALVVGTVTVKSLLSLLPMAGGVASELVSGLIEPILSRRMYEWAQEVTSRINEGLNYQAEHSPDRIFQSEEFTTAFVRASRVAIATHQREKLEALRNAVVHVAIGEAPDDSLQTIFFGAIETLTPWHLKALDCIADPVAWADRHQYWIEPTRMPNAVTIIEAFYRDQMPVKGFEKQLVQDLYNLGLATNNVDPRGQLYLRAEEDTYPLITDLGKAFLRFISDWSIPDALGG